MESTKWSSLWLVPFLVKIEKGAIIKNEQNNK